MHFYSNEEIEFLKKISPGKTNKEITKLFNKKFNLNLSEKAISATRKRYGIKTGSDGKFRRGHKPWNKGLKGVVTGGVQTQFKKGDKPPNWVPIGTERVSKDGYIEIKVADGRKQKNWKPKHHIIYEKYNGPIPKGHAVIFGDGDKRNFDINNLILVLRRQLLTMNRNNLIKNDADLTRTGVVIANLYQKISERKNNKK
jgi:hypothetical protein